MYREVDDGKKKGGKISFGVILSNNVNEKDKKSRENVGEVSLT